MMRGRDIVCISSLDWDAHWTSKQQIMLRLSETNQVLYVEEPVTALAPFKVPSRWKRWTAVVPDLRKVRPGLWVLTPPPLSPFGNMYPRVNRANQHLLAGYVNWAIREIGMDDPLLWTYLPGSCALIDHLTPRAVVYHCVDEHSAFPGFVSPEVVKVYDRELTRRADLVLTSAQNLLAARQSLNPNIHHIRHAADVQLFTSALDPALPIPDDLAAIPRPRIGVVGVHDERLDVAALETLAGADPHWQVVLVGPVVAGDVDEDRLRALPNVHLLGNKPVQQLPAYLKGLDVGLIPYLRNELTRNVFPLKLYEYLAAGLPVVAAALPELAPFAGRIALAMEPQDYPALVEHALVTDSAAARAARARSVADETWEKRVEEISRLVEAVLAGRETRAAAGWDRATGSTAGVRLGGIGSARRGAGPAQSGAVWPSVSVLEFRLDLVGLEEAARWAVGVAAGDDTRPEAATPMTAGPAGRHGRTVTAVSFNPELVMEALQNPAAAEALLGADLAYPDGVGAVWAARRTLEPGPALDPGPQRVAGIDLADRILDLAAETAVPVYLLGAKPGVAEEAARRQQARFPGLQVAGCRDGYFSSEEEEAVVAEVRTSGARILLVGMGAPKQEILIHRHRHEWGAALALGIGGSLDVWAGTVGRAPEWVRRAGVEWLFRLARDPKRLRRQLALPRYAYRVVISPPQTAGDEATPGEQDGATSPSRGTATLRAPGGGEK